PGSLHSRRPAFRRAPACETSGTGSLAHRFGPRFGQRFRPRGLCKQAGREEVRRMICSRRIPPHAMFVWARCADLSRRKARRMLLFLGGAFFFERVGGADGTIV